MTDYERIKREYDLSLLQKNRLMDKVWPVGSIYLSLDATDPSVRFGGVWERIKDTFLLAAGDNYEAGDTGGEASVELHETEMPAHSHNFSYASAEHESFPYSSEAVGGQYINFYLGTANTGNRIGIANAGDGQPHNNMPPYLAVHIWTRIR